MDSTLTDLTQIAVVVLVAVALGLILVRLRQPPIVGYILTGIVLGPTALGFVGQTEAIKLLAEMGVLLLLFLIGMELSLRTFITVLRPAALTALLQILASLIVTFAFGYIAGWTTQASILLGFAIAVSSSALVIKMLEEIDELRTDLGRITVGVLIAQDIAIVPILLLSESLGGGYALDLWVVGKMVLAIAGLVALIWVLSRPGKVVIPFSDRIAGKPDLLTLAMLAICLAGASLSGLFGLSPVYGAFVAGLIVGQSNLRAKAIPATHPVQSLLIVVFFLSIGLLIDLNFIAENWALLLAFVSGIIVLKSVLNVAILRFVGEPWETAFPAGIIMSQVGEFSFVTAAVGLRASVIDYSAYQTVIAVIAVSLLISPFWLITVRRFHDVAEKGVANFRLALAEIYENEIAGVEKGAAGVRKATQSVRHWGHAAKVTVLAKRPGLALGAQKSTEEKAREGGEGDQSEAVEEAPAQAGPAELSARPGDAGQGPAGDDNVAVTKASTPDEVAPKRQEKSVEAAQGKVPDQGSTPEEEPENAVEPERARTQPSS